MQRHVPKPRADAPGPELEPREVAIAGHGVWLRGDLAVPAQASGLIVFAHGTGSSRKSPRNRMVARALQRANLGTLLMDLLSEEEEREEAAGAMLRFDVRLLAQRLVTACEWIDETPALQELRIGYFGASTGAAAALIAAAQLGERVRAVVSRGGRPDLAPPEALARVRAPTLLIVGARDERVVELNREAMEHLRCEHRLEIIPFATHLFEEPGALERVATSARDFYLRSLAPREPSAGRGA